MQTLLDFLYDLIEIQIDKYIKLAKTGIGPDAEINAFLVTQEVEELLELAQSLKDNPNQDLDKPLAYIHFYLEQEQLRANAGWLFDENNIHNGVKDRTQKQIKELQSIANQLQRKLPKQPTAQTAIQASCMYVSYTIALGILSKARELRENPEMQLSERIPKRARMNLRINARTRYVEKQEEIDALYEQYSRKITQLTIQPKIIKISYKKAQVLEEKHRKHLESLTEKSSLQELPQVSTNSYSWYKNALMRKGIAISATVFFAFMYWYCRQNNEETSHESQPLVKDFFL